MSCERRKVCVVTGTRAEYGLLYWLMREILEADNLTLQLIVTGAHLSAQFGATYRQIEQDGFIINWKVDMLLCSDSETGISKSMGLAMVGFADAYSNLQPDLLVLLGDRYEVFAAAAAATVARIPIAHLHGGEVSEGVIDEPFRHSITKMSHLHFTASEVYRRRVIQLGEDAERVFTVGSLGVENIQRMQLLSREDLEQSIGFQLGRRNLLVTYHPVTLESETAEQQFANLLAVCEGLEYTHLIFTKANVDTGGQIINTMIDLYVRDHSDSACAFTSLGQLRYLSAMQYVDAVVGNSSSGLLEAPSFKVGTVNIGDRQRGRVKAQSVIDCGVMVDEIKEAIEGVYSSDFQQMLRQVQNPFDGGNVASKVVDVLKEYPLDSILKKHFNDF